LVKNVVKTALSEQRKDNIHEAVSSYLPAFALGGMLSLVGQMVCGKKDDTTRSTALPPSAQCEFADGKIQTANYSITRQGRTIFGGVVPFDKSGAQGRTSNCVRVGATTIVTTDDLNIGGHRRSRGAKYTLYTLPGEYRAGSFIITKQTGNGVRSRKQQDRACCT